MDERTHARYIADIDYFLSKMETEPNSGYFIPLALAYNKLEKYDDTIAMCKSAIEHFPSNCAAKTFLAEAYIYKGNPDLARELLFDVTAEDDNNYKALKLLGIICKNNDENTDALKYLTGAYIRAPEDEEVIRMIEELGGTLSPIEIYEERMNKQAQNAATEEEDEELKTYQEIEQKIHNAELIMADLVADRTIMGGRAAKAEAEEQEELEDLENKDTNTEEVVEETPPSISIETDPDSTELSDDDLEKLLAAANAAGVRNNTDSDDDNDDFDPNNIIISDTPEEPAKKSKKDTHEDSDNSLANALNDNNDLASALSSDNDLASALEDNDNNLANALNDNNDLASALSSDNDLASALEDSDNSLANALNDNNNDLASALSSDNDLASALEDSDNSLANALGIESDENITTTLDNIINTDEEKVIEENKHKKEEQKTKEHTDKKANIDPIEFEKQEELKLSRDTAITEEQAEKEHDKAVKEVEAVTHHSEKLPKSIKDMSYEDMIGDDDNTISEDTEISSELGESAPFTQSDIMDEIFGSAGINKEDLLDDEPIISKKERHVKKLENMLDKVKSNRDNK